jgi:hypothetical protein
MQDDVCRGSEQQQHKLCEWLFARVLASHYGGSGSIPRRVFKVTGPLEDLGKVSS